MSKRDIARGYDALDERCFMPRKFHQRIVKLAGCIAGSVLDVGCGPGILVQAVRECHPHVRIMGCDLAYGLCSKARARHPGLPIAEADAELLPFRNHQFDVVFLTEVLEHLLEPKQALHEIKRVLKPCGRLILSVPNRDWLKYDNYMAHRMPFQPIDDHWYRVAELGELLTSVGFQSIAMHGGEKLYFGGGLMHQLERLALVLSRRLRQKMQRLIVIAVSSAA